MKTNRSLPHLPALALTILIVASPRDGAAEWQRSEQALAWRAGTNVLWQFNFDPQLGKAHFHPLASPAGTVFTQARPADHVWHYGLWFSWKYINGVNYWEENHSQGGAEGATRWTIPDIQTTPDGGAAIRFNINYSNPTGRVDLSESRELRVMPQPDGGYAIDWRANFKAGTAGAELGRTPMPGEPGGQVNGGYAGLGLRLANRPLDLSLVCSTGSVTHFQSDRTRPHAPALACNLTSEDEDAAGIAILSDPANVGENAPWYMVNSRNMRFACAAILAPKVRTLKPGEEMVLRYRIAVRAGAWTPASLQVAHAAWLAEKR